MTRLESLRHRREELLAQNADYETVYNTLQAASDLEAVDQLRRLRDHTDVEKYAEMLRRGTTLATKHPPRRVQDYMHNKMPSRTPPASSTEPVDLLDSEIDTHVDLSAKADCACSSQSPPMLIDPTLNSQWLFRFANLPGAPIQVWVTSF